MFLLRIYIACVIILYSIAAKMPGVSVLYFFKYIPFGRWSTDVMIDEIMKCGKTIYKTAVPQDTPENKPAT